jgi:hypothetical protein
MIFYLKVRDHDCQSWHYFFQCKITECKEIAEMYIEITTIIQQFERTWQAFHAGKNK